MKRVHNSLLLASLMLCAVSNQLVAKLDFGSQQSKIRVGASGRLNVSSSNLTVAGTLATTSGATLSGNSISFDDGILATDDSLAQLSGGSIDPSNSNAMALGDGDKLMAEPGRIINGITTATDSNCNIAGQPTFASQIVVGSGSNLSLNLQSVLNKNIKLNGGGTSVISLGDDLSLADNVKIVGSGTVSLNSRRLNLPASSNSAWTGDLTFQNALDLTLNGSLRLDGSWKFQNNSVLQGNGAVLDLSNGGQLIIDTGATLQVNNLVIKGVGASAGQIVFNDAAGQMLLSDSLLALTDSYTLDQGTVYVQGPTTFALGRHDLTFGSNANLTVDGSSLWLDYLDAPVNPGTIYAPKDIVTDLASDIAAGRLSLTNRGTIKSAVDGGVVNFNPAAIALVTGDVTSNLTLAAPVILNPGQTINLQGTNQVLDGGGAYVEFTNGNQPQFLLDPGTSGNNTVTLQNIELRNVKQSTFDIRTKPGSPKGYSQAKIIIGKNVTWELDEDLTFTNGYLEIADPDNTGNIFTIRGKGSRKKLTIAPNVTEFAAGQANPIFAMGHNTLLLDNVELVGVPFITSVNDDAFSAAVALAHSAAIDLDADTALNIFVEGASNDLLLLANGITLSGNISFGDRATNELTVRFNLPAYAEYPNVILDGDPGLQLFSLDGIAHLRFADYTAQVTNNNSNAFVADANGILSYNTLRMLGSPIKQQATSFRYDGINLLGVNPDTGSIRALHKIGRRAKINAYQIHRQLVKDAREAVQADVIARAKKEQAPRPVGVPKQPTNKMKPKKTGKPRIRELEEEFTLRELDVLRSIETRSLTLPTAFDLIIANIRQFSTQPYANAIKFERASIGGISPTGVLTGFSLNPSAPFTGLLNDHSTLSIIANNVTLDDNHILYVQGSGNVLEVSGSMAILGQSLRMQDDAELTIRLMNKNAFVIILGTLNIPKNGSLLVDGNGEKGGRLILFPDTTINMQGSKVDGTVSGRAKLDVSNGATLELTPLFGELISSSRIIGVGAVSVGNEGTLNMTHARLIFGADTPNIDGNLANPRSETINDINFNVLSGARIAIGDGGRLSFRYLTSSHKIRGNIEIATGGSFALNAFGGVEGESSDLAAGSDLVSFSLNSNGRISLVGGVLALGENRTDGSVATPFGFDWDGSNGVIAAAGGLSGTVRYVTYAASSITERPFTAMGGVAAANSTGIKASAIFNALTS